MKIGLSYLLCLQFVVVIAVAEIKTLYGPYTTRADDSISRVKCPIGTVVFACLSERADCSDGALMTVAGDECILWHRWAKPATRVIAKCALTTCGESWITVMSPKVGYSKARPMADCPEGYEMTGCNVRSQWMQDNPSLSARVGKRVVNGKNISYCTTSQNCTGGQGCHVQARCRKTE